MRSPCACSAPLYQLRKKSPYSLPQLPPGAKNPVSPGLLLYSPLSWGPPWPHSGRSRARRGRERRERAAVVALELADAGEAPAARLRVAREPQLAAGAHAHDDLLDQAAQVGREGAGEGGHELLVALRVGGGVRGVGWGGVCVSVGGGGGGVGATAGGG